MPFVEVRWLDSASITKLAWLHPEQLDSMGMGISKCVTRGWLVRKDNKEVVLAMCAADGTMWGGFWAIPRGSITSIKKARQP